LSNQLETFLPLPFIPSVPSHQAFQYPPPSTPPVSEDRFECAIELPDPEITPSAKGLLAAIRSNGFMRAMDDLVAPHLEPGSPGRNALDKFGLFNVNQVATVIPTPWGMSHKFGIQANIVKPDIHPHTGNYYLQLFPVHNEIGFNLLETFAASSLKDYLPEWCGFGTQFIFNHGVELPIVHTEEGWKLQGPGNGAMYVEELVFRPLESALRYGGPVQATLAPEFGTHLKWTLDNPNAKWALATTFASSAIGAATGFAAAWAGAGDPLLLTHIGAMLGQLTAHGVQCWSNALCPDKVVTWAGATFSAADVNTAHFMEYPRIWWHGHEGEWHLRDLKPQSERILAQFFERQRQNRAIEMAEMGIDNIADPVETISERYAAQL
jgi:non-LEE-encoded effector NleA